jgi:hypothetical protein
VTFSFGAGGMALYLDGVLADDDAFAGGLLGNREPVVIGASSERNRDESGDLGAIRTSNGFRGSIDEVAILDAALDASQVAQLIEFGPVGVVE